MADAADSKSVARKGVWVRLPPSTPTLFKTIENLGNMRFMRVLSGSVVRL